MEHHYMMETVRSSTLVRCLLALLVALLPGRAPAYSVFTHEQLVDLSWKDLIEPVLLARYPKTTPAQLELAHSYAYGGCAIQDLGYYPFGKEFFSDLTHYVRAGDFVTALLHNAQNVNEYAFALGALSHYMGDVIGHKDAVNPAVASAFPKLARKYGPTVNYGEGPHQHVRVEFAFDIGQLSQHRLAPAAYLEHIGLRVSRSLLDRTFAEVYGLPLTSVLGEARPAIRTYRTAVRTFLPRFAYAESFLHRHEFPPDTPDPAFEIYSHRLAQTDFQKTWNPYRRKPGVKTFLIAIVVRIVPKVGAASDLKICIPTPYTEDLYIRSVNRSVDAYRNFLGQIKASPTSSFALANRDLDTGDLNRPGAYPLTDRTYAKLLHKLTRKDELAIPPALESDVLTYYANPNAPISTRQNTHAWQRVQSDLARLREKPLTSPTPTPSPDAPALVPSSATPAASQTQPTPAASHLPPTPDIR